MVTQMQQSFKACCIIVSVCTYTCGLLVSSWEISTDQNRKKMRLGCPSGKLRYSLEESNYITL